MTEVMTSSSRLLDSGADLVPEGELPEIPKDLTKSAARGFVLTLAGFVCLQIASFATYVVAGHYLDSSELGVVGKFLTVLFWMDVLLDMGMGAAIIRDQEKGQTERVGIAFSVNTIVAVVVSIGLFFAAPTHRGVLRCLRSGGRCSRCSRSSPWCVVWVRCPTRCSSATWPSGRGRRSG